MSSSTKPTELHQIGAVEVRVGLSQRTIRHYDEIGLVAPSGRSPGGFRLYTDGDIDRLVYVKAMKPLGFTLEEAGELLRIHDRLAAGDAIPQSMLDSLRESAETANERCAKLKRQLAEAHELTTAMWEEVALGESRGVRQADIDDPA